MDILFGILLFLVVLIFSAILHEIMHGLVAYKLGDPTAKLMGRLTLNPLPHIDPIGSILVPLVFILPALITQSFPSVFFAWAKPVPVNPIHFRDPRRDMALVALAGPLTNFLIACIAALLFSFLRETILADILISIVAINLSLGFLNIIPIPPLDGSKIFTILLPADIARSYLSIERYGIFILFFLLNFPIAGIDLGRILGLLINRSMILLGM